ncbi:hypothetical protein KVR01_002416 [Diaporthe batatas]|uniref:uncharacterized protein n=1 Tax=Diaporthe batatas TaxID=748121 RepID=UPI001D058D44|nr:uncharacterized protein KVR01_002416 [Diaporthe batatas]KAG8166727.1 hypothetical protein KVR01_002416 [Diaporthe batatas]
MGRNRTWAKTFKCQQCGARHFGLQGAAGIALVVRNARLPGNPATHIILQFRRDTRSWALPGGVLDYGETPKQAALREAEEEISLPRNADEGNDPLITIRQQAALFDHGQWRYTTFIADVNRRFLPKRPPQDTEGIAVAWAPIDEVGVQGGRFFPLHPAFWNDWEKLRDMIRAMDGPAPVAQPVPPVPPVQPVQPQPVQPQPVQPQPVQPQPVQVQPVQPVQPADPPANPDVQLGNDLAQLTLGFPVTTPGAQQPATRRPPVNPGWRPADRITPPPAPPNVPPTLGFPKTAPGPPPGRNVQATDPGRGVNPMPPAPVPPLPPVTAPADTWRPPVVQSGIMILDDSDDGSEEDWRTPQAPGPPQVPGPAQAPGFAKVPGPAQVPGPLQFPTPPQDPGPAQLPTPPQDPTPPHVPGPAHAGPSTHVGSNNGTFFVNSQGPPDPSFAPGKIRYMTWTQQTAPDGQCRPS